VPLAEAAAVLLPGIDLTSWRGHGLEPAYGIRSAHDSSCSALAAAANAGSKESIHQLLFRLGAAHIFLKAESRVLGHRPAGTRGALDNNVPSLREESIRTGWC
jgi:hypothetical protein